MNSLAYLSRQFDVLASAKTSPSTPASDHHRSTAHHTAGSDPPLQRTKTWSTKSFLFPPPPSPGVFPRSSFPKRSFSSPAVSVTPSSTQPTPRVRVPVIAAARSSAAPSSAPLETPRSKTDLETAIRRVFFIRVFLLVWSRMRAFWVSWSGGMSEEPVRESAVGAKRTTADEKGLGSNGSVHHEAYTPSSSSSQVQPPIVSPPPPPPPASPLSTQLFPPPSDLPNTDPTLVFDAKPISPPSPLSASTTPQSPDTPSVLSRSSTPVLGARKTPFPLPKTLVLDLDETLIHSTSRPIYSSGSSGSGIFGLTSFGSRNKGAGHMVEVVLGGRSTLYHVYKRPFVDYFLRTVSGWYTLVIFTASMQEYADPVIDWLDAGRGILAHRLFRDSCTQLPNGSYTKDLSMIEADLSRVCLVDNSPISYRINEANGIPIEGWTHDPSDEALMDLLPVLDSLRFTSDVRRVLGLRSVTVSS